MRGAVFALDIEKLIVCVGPICRPYFYAKSAYPTAIFLVKAALF